MEYKTVFFRAFEPEDAQLIYKWKNDHEMMRDAVGMPRPVSMAECNEWVAQCAKRDPFNFWFAICLNDDSKKMIGYTAVNNVHFVNSSATCNVIVIGDKECRDGISWLETNLFIREFVFEKLHLNRYYGQFSETQRMTFLANKLFYSTIEGVARQAIWSKGQYHDLYMVSMLREEYLLHKNKGDYELSSLIRRFRKLLKGDAT